MKHISNLSTILLKLNPCSSYLTAEEKGAVIERRRLGMEVEDIIQKVYDLNKPGVDSQKAYVKAKARMNRILERAGMH
jgi:hypothetical protein